MSACGQVREIWRYPIKSMGGERLERTEAGPDGLSGDRGWALRDEDAGEIRGGKQIPRIMMCEARYLEEPAPGAIPDAEITLPDGATLRTDDPACAERLSAFLERKVTLWRRRPATDTEHYRRAAALDSEQALRAYLGRVGDEPLPDLSSVPEALVHEIVEYSAPLGTYFDVTSLHLLSTNTLDRLHQIDPGADFAIRRFRPNVLVECPGGPGFPENAWSGHTFAVGSAHARGDLPTPRCGMTACAQPGLPKDASILRTIVREAEQAAGLYATFIRAGAIRVGDDVRLHPDG